MVFNTVLPRWLASALERENLERIAGDESTGDASDHRERRSRITGWYIGDNRRAVWQMDLRFVEGAHTKFKHHAAPLMHYKCPQPFLGSRLMPP